MDLKELYEEWAIRDPTFKKVAEKYFAIRKKG